MPTILTDRCGELEYRDEDVIQFPAGLVGMPDLKRWLMLDFENGIPMKWMQSLDRPDFGVPVASPYFYLEDYDPGLPYAILEDLGEARPEDLVVMIISRVHPGGEKITGNLLSPIVMGANSHCGCQWTASNFPWPIQQEMNYLKFGLAVDDDSSENGPGIAGDDESGESNARPEAELPEPHLV